VDLDEMKRQYLAKQEQIRRLEAERAAILGRREPTPWRLRFRLEMRRVEAEELRMWGNRELTRQIREATKNDEISLSISQHAFRT
jgi:arginase family enzyme